MRKTYLVAVLVVGLASATAGFGTMAYFNDTETAQDNTVQAGTVDISVNTHNPWSHNFTMELKPSQVRIWTTMLTNEGNNPVNVYKRNVVTDLEGGLHPEPEWLVDPDNSADLFPEDVGYSFHIQLIDEEGHHVAQGDIYMSHPTEISDVNDTWITAYPNPAIELSPGHENETLPDALPPGWSLEIAQDYHIRETVGNEAQGDKLVFNTTYLATQTNAPAPTPAAP